MTDNKPIQPPYTDARRLQWILDTLYHGGAYALVKKLRYGYGEPPNVADLDEVIRIEEREKARLQPPTIEAFVKANIGQVWTEEDAEEVMRQWRRMDQLATELVERARSEGKFLAIK